MNMVYFLNILMIFNLEIVKGNFRKRPIDQTQLKCN